MIRSTSQLPALDDGARYWSPGELAREVAALALLLRAQRCQVLATLMDNSPAWVAADLAAAEIGVVHVPLPVFFMPGQIAHALQSAGVDALLGPPALAARWPGADCLEITVAGQPLVLIRVPNRAVALPAGTVKITFTSGSTGAPKGVCLSAEALARTTGGLVQALGALDIQRHLCVLPLPVLLENVAGLLAPMARGATCVVLPLAAVGLTGSSGFDVAQFHAAVSRQQPDSLIVLPQMLKAWTAYLAHTAQRAPDRLKFVAVGGAAVGAGLIQAARGVGIPAYEGYGLSEGASVQTLNLPGADRPGSAGRPLPHARVRLTPEGELEVTGSRFAGYLGEPARPADAWLPTGDLGRIDADGFIHLMGRKKNLLITAFGRNVSPEWVETVLGDSGPILQAVVYGEAQATLSAVLWPLSPAVPDAALQAAVDTANRQLPDYARIGHWVRSAAPFNATSGMATANGRPQRAAILQAYADGLRMDG